MRRVVESKQPKEKVVASPSSKTSPSSQKARQLLRTRPYILGPVSLRIYHSSEMKRSFIVFGETHRELSKCAPSVAVGRDTLPFDVYFETLAHAYPARQFDYFVEIPVKTKFESAGKQFGKTKGAYDTAHILEAWRKCWRRQKLLCPLPPNARAHYIDIRHHPLFMDVPADWINIDGKDTFARDAVSDLRNHLVGSEKKKKAEIMSTALLRHMHRILETWESQAIKLFGKEAAAPLLTHPSWLLFVFLKIEKQIRAVASPRVQRALVRFYVERIATPIDQMAAFLQTFPEHRVLKEIRQAIEDYPNPAPSKILNLVNGMDSFYTAIITLVDMYAVARMCRTFSTGRPIQNVVFYAGDVHAQNVVSFFEKYLRQSPVLKASIVEDKNQIKCLEVGHVKWDSVLVP